MQVITVLPYKTFRERIKAVKDLRGTISIESTYIMATQNVKGDKQ